MKNLMLPRKMDPTSLVVNSIVPCVLEYHNLTLSTHLIIAAESASIFTICSSLRERVGDDELDGPCDVEPERKRKHHTDPKKTPIPV
jgi:hypothetical protein